MVIEHQTLEMWKVLSCRAKMTLQELEQKKEEISRLLEQTGAIKVGPMVTATFSAEKGSSGALLDVELMVPLDRKIPLPAGYTWKPHFRLTNALMGKHRGNPATVRTTANEMSAYIAEHRLVPISVSYSVTVREPTNPAVPEDAEIDIYVGISPNLL